MTKLTFVGGPLAIKQTLSMQKFGAGKIFLNVFETSLLCSVCEMQHYITCSPVDPLQ